MLGLGKLWGSVDVEVRATLRMSWTTGPRRQELNDYLLWSLGNKIGLYIFLVSDRPCLIWLLWTCPSMLWKRLLEASASVTENHEYRYMLRKLQMTWSWRNGLQHTELRRYCGSTEVKVKLTKPRWIRGLRQVLSRRKPCPWQTQVTFSLNQTTTVHKILPPNPIRHAVPFHVPLHWCAPRLNSSLSRSEAPQNSLTSSIEL
jgi:hypothetical protein